MIDVKCLTDLDLPGAKVTDALMLKEHSGTLFRCEAFAGLKFDRAKRHCLALVPSKSFCISLTASS